MDAIQTHILQEDGILILTCTGVLDEKNSPAIFGNILKYAKQAPQILIVDLEQCAGIKTVFITGVIEISKYIHASGGYVLVVPGKMTEILEMTGVATVTKIISSVEEGKVYGREHFPHVIDFIREQKEKSQTKTERESIEITEKYSFFTDEAKKIVDLEAILEYAIKHHASDIHLATDNLISYRIEGEITKLHEEATLSAEHMNQIKTIILGKYPKILEKFENNHDADFGYISKKDKVSFRVNGFWSLGEECFTFRRIEQTPKTIAELGLPKAINSFIEARQGLILVTGPTGSGKSTTLVAMLEEINNRRAENIITIEDPIEFLFTDKKSIFSQREVGRDTDSFVAAIRAAMREDPDIVMVGEMRDSETVEAALNLAETGHLVFSTLHTAGSAQTISRIIQFFSPDAQKQIFNRLADSILGVLSQRLVARSDQPGKRIALFELMIANSGIKNLIRTGDMAQINNAIQMGRSEGMIPMYTYAQDLEQKGIIKREDYIGYFTHQDI